MIESKCCSGSILLFTPLFHFFAHPQLSPLSSSSSSSPPYPLPPFALFNSSFYPLLCALFLSSILSSLLLLSSPTRCSYRTSGRLCGCTTLSPIEQLWGQTATKSEYSISADFILPFLPCPPSVLPYVVSPYIVLSSLFALPCLALLSFVLHVFGPLFVLFCSPSELSYPVELFHILDSHLVASSSSLYF